ncbi:MAG: tail fiber domain-containing protein [Bdellovibrionales bacterium]|nr:tail fiber domain-containing protein [Bdellovibrionales bacterium]
MKMKRLWDVCSILSLLLLASHAWAGTGLTYHGRILKPDGSALEGPAVQFTLQIRSPGNESCLLYQETQTINMSDSGGAFSLEIGADPTYRVAASVDGGYSLAKVFANNSTLTLPNCAYGSTYTPNTADSRLLYISFNDGSGAQNLTAQKINYVPYAIESMQVNGYKANQLLRVDTGSAPVLTSGNLTVLNDLFNGVLTNSTASLKLPTTVGTSGQVMQTDGSGNLSWVTPASGLGYTPLNKAGDTLSGALELASNNLINTGNISMASNKYFTLSANTTNGTVAGQMWYDTGVIKYFDGTSVRALGVSGAAPTLAASDITGALGYTPVSSANGYVNGGNTFGANATVGLNDAFKLGFKTNNTTQMTLDSNGNLGVGTASPWRKLHVQYTASASDDGIIVDNLGNAGANLSLKSSGAGGHEYMMISTGSANSTGAGSFGIFDQNAVSYRMVIGPTGNVGIGMLAPAYTLDLGSRTDALRLPSGLDATRPTNAAGLIRYNTTSNVVEYNNGSAWITVGSSGGSLPAIAAGQVWVGNASGAAQAFSLSGDVASVSNTGSVVVNKTTTGQANYILALDGSGVANVKGLDMQTGTGKVTLQTAGAFTNYVLTLPNAAPANNQILKSDASGNLSWVTYLAQVSDSAPLTNGKMWIGNASGIASEVTLSGDATISNAGLLTLKNTGTVGTYFKVVTDAQGRVTSGGALASGDVITALGYTPATPGSGYINGGNTFGADATMGLNDNHNLGFRTNNKTQMTLTGTGYLGVGTATPRGNLDVTSPDVAEMFLTSSSGANYTGSGLVLQSLSAAGGSRAMGIFMHDEADQDEWFAGRPFNWIGDNDAYIISRKTSTANHDRSTSEGVLSLLTIKGNGNVGIGNNTPSVSLDLSAKTDAVSLPKGTTAQQPSNAAGLIRYNTSNNVVEYNNGSGWLTLASNSAGTPFVNGGNSFGGAATLGTNDNNNLNFEANNTTIMTIKPAGTIGINTNNQSATLAIAKSTAPTTITAANSYLHLGADEQNSNSYRLISFGYKTLEVYPAAYMGFQETSTSNSSRGDLVFGARSSTSDVAPVEIMRLTSAGNLSLPKAATRIVSDFSNATVANRTFFQTSTTDQNTVVGALPNNSGSSNANPGSGFQVFNNASPTNAAVGMLAADQGLVYIASNVTGTGTALPLAFVLNTSEKMRIQTDGSVGIGTSAPNAKLQVTRDFGTANGGGATVASFQGNNAGDQNYYLLAAYHGPSWRFLVDGTGNANFAGTVSQSSDLRLKQDITTIDGALEKLSPIRGVNYYWADPTRSTKKQLGVIAQEVEKSFPEAISEDKEGYKTVNYTGLIGPIIQGLKELHNKWFVDSSKIHEELLEQKRAISSLEEQNKLLKSALCEKDPSYSFCQR